MNLGIVCFPTYGGSGVIATELAVSLALRNHRVHLFSYAPPGRLTCRSENLKFHQVDDFISPPFHRPYYSIDLATRIAEVAREEGLDLVNAHYAVPHSVSALLARQIVAKPFAVVTTLHGTDTTWLGSNPSYVPLLRHLLTASDAVTAVSRNLAGLAREKFAPGLPIEVLYNFVDTERFRPAAAREKGPTRLVHVSNFRPVKRSPDVVRTFAEVRKRLPQAPLRFFMVGDGPELPQARRLAAELGIGKDTCFLGMQDDVESMVGTSDILVMASEYESFGLASVEAMACQVPVVATRCGGVEEVVEDGVTGFTRPVGDVQGLADRCVELVNDPELRRRMGAAGRERTLRLFSMEEGVRRYETFYQGVIEKRKGT